MAPGGVMPGIQAPRVLVVDDSAAARDALRLALESEGVVVVGEAGDGADGVEAAACLQPDVVVMDLRMPRMDGIAATREIKRAQPLVQVLLFTAYDDAERGAVEAGAYAYLVKGCSPGLVHDVVEMAWKLKVGLELRERSTTAPPAG